MKLLTGQISALIIHTVIIIVALHLITCIAIHPNLITKPMQRHNTLI